MSEKAVVFEDGETGTSVTAAATGAVIYRHTAKQTGVGIRSPSDAR